MTQKLFKEFQMTGLPIFFEDFNPYQASRFDSELDEICKKYANDTTLQYLLYKVVKVNEAFIRTCET